MTLDRVKTIIEKNISGATADAENILGDFRSDVGGGQFDAIAHRVVHGGEMHHSALLNDATLSTIQRAAQLAPLHNPLAVRWIEASKKIFGDRCKHCAVFDTALFAELPPVAATYPIPREFREKYSIKRYGFHGIAHKALYERLAELDPETAKGRVITLQLGSGCSATAFYEGKPVDTSMGFTPLEGLMMSSRCGDIDAGAVLYLLQHTALSARDLENILNRSSGLFAIGGVADMKGLLKLETPDAKLAVEMFCYRVRKYIGAFAAVMGGLDALVFGGGVGTNSAEIRARCVGGLEFLGLSLNQEQNEAAVGKEANISETNAPVSILVLPVSEGALMAREAAALL